MANAIGGIESHERAVPGAGELSSAVDYFLERTLGVEVSGDSNARLAQTGELTFQGFDFSPERFRVGIGGVGW